MIKQIERFSPHQNAKVMAILMAIGSLIFLLPFMLLASLAAPRGARMPMALMLLLPVFYLVIGYLGVAAGCWIYNAMFRYVGGIEFDDGAPADER